MGFILAFVGIMVITLATVGIVSLFEIVIRDNKTIKNDKE